MSCFDHLLLADVLCHFISVLGQLLNFFCLINGFNSKVYACVSDFFVSWLKKKNWEMCSACFVL